MALGYFDSGDGLFSARSLACCYINFPFNLLLMLVFFGTMYIHFQSLATSQHENNKLHSQSWSSRSQKKCCESLKLRASGSIKLQQNSTHNMRERHDFWWKCSVERKKVSIETWDRTFVSEKQIESESTHSMKLKSKSIVIRIDRLSTFSLLIGRCGINFEKLFQFSNRRMERGMERGKNV